MKSSLRQWAILSGLICSLSGCGGEEDYDDDYDYGYGWDVGKLNVQMGYGSAGSSTAMTIDDLPEGEKSYVKVEVFRAEDILDSGVSWISPVASRVFSADQTNVELQDLPVDEPLMIDITTYDFTAQPTFVGRGHVTLYEGVMSRMNISMRPFGMFLKAIVSPIAKKRDWSGGKDRVQWRYEVTNATLKDQTFADVTAEVLNPEISGSITALGMSTMNDGFCCSTFPPFGTRLSRETAPYLEIPNGFRKPIHLRVTIKFGTSAGSVTTTQNVTFMPDYSGL